jgi:hypothetical protein
MAMEERERTAEDRVLSCTAAAEFLGKSRQAIHKGVDDGRYPGFRDPSTGRVWVDWAWVELNAPGGLRLLARLEVLEANAEGATAQLLPTSADRVAELERLVDQLQADKVGLREENRGLREQNAATQTENLIVLAAAADLQKAVTLLEEAQKHDERARRTRRRAASASRRASEKYQEAVTQAQLPRSPADLPS